jgi:hypothetical protein
MSHKNPRGSTSNGATVQNTTERYSVTKLGTLWITAKREAVSAPVSAVWNFAAKPTNSRRSQHFTAQQKTDDDDDDDDDDVKLRSPSDLPRVLVAWPRTA